MDRDDIHYRINNRKSMISTLYLRRCAYEACVDVLKNNGLEDALSAMRTMIDTCDDSIKNNNLEIDRYRKMLEKEED